MTSTDIALEKSILRQKVRQKRKTFAHRNSLYASAFTRHLLAALPSEARSVAAFLPMPGEPPIREALLEMHRQGLEILVPVVEKKRQLSWVRWLPDTTYALSPLGIEEPTGKRFNYTKFVTADLHLIPALAYDCLGKRLGQGGGYYDRLLTDQQEVRTKKYLGVIFSDELFETIPVEKHDAALNYLITEKGLTELAQK